MKVRRAAVIAGAYGLTAVVFFLLGRATAPEADWSPQHIDRSSDPDEFDNAFLGLTVRVPSRGGWRLLSEPEKFRPTPADVNKVLEIERMLDEGSSDTEWARMDLYVEPLSSSGRANEVLRKLDFRGHRSNLTLDAAEKLQIGGKPGHIQVGAWSLAGKHYRVVTYSVEHRGKLLVFKGVTPADGFEGFVPAFDEILQSVRLR